MWLTLLCSHCWHLLDEQSSWLGFRGSVVLLLQLMSRLAESPGHHRPPLQVPSHCGSCPPECPGAEHHCSQARGRVSLDLTSVMLQAGSSDGVLLKHFLSPWLVQGRRLQPAPSPHRALCMCKSCPWPQMICLHFIIDAGLDLRQIRKDNFLNRCCRSLVSYLSNKFQSTSRCFCHCNQRRLLFSSSNYKARATQGKFILFKSVLVSPNSLLCH